MSLEPARLNFSVWKGATFQKRLTYHQSDEASTAVDLTGYSASLIVSTASGTSLLTLSSGSGLVLGGVAGTIDIIISSTTTGGFTWRAANYNLSITSPAGNKDYLLYGNFSVKGF